MLIVPDELQAERNAVMAEIYTAFKGGSRNGGVSWNETMVMDDYGSMDKCRTARETDTDRNWTELASDDTWDAGPGFGGWSFLDPIGFCYYLPAAMVRHLRAGHKAYRCFGLDMILMVDKATKPRGIQLRENTIHQWSLLDDRQCRCVARFVRFMDAWETATLGQDRAAREPTDWAKMYANYWKAFA